MKSRGVEVKRGYAVSGSGRLMVVVLCKSDGRSGGMGAILSTMRAKKNAYNIAIYIFFKTEGVHVHILSYTWVHP